MGQMNDKTRKENLQLFGIAVDLSEKARQQEQFEEKIALDRGNADRMYNLEVEKYNDLKARAAATNLSFDEVLAQQVLSGAITPAMEKVLKLKHGSEEGGGKPFQDALNKVTPGTIQDGYKFKGGDPSVESNWEKVK
jgi:hypothetical protein